MKKKIKNEEEQIYFLDDYIPSTKDAGCKARIDAREIFLRRGYKSYPINYQPGKTFFLKVHFYISVFFRLCKIPRHSIIAVQFPFYYLDRISILFSYIASFKHLRIIILLHDLDFLRFGGKYGLKQKKGCRILFKAKNIISHNQKMTEVLEEIGIDSKRIVNLKVFDYLLDSRFPVSAHLNGNTVVFAGNLTKSLFCKNLKAINLKNISIRLYGVTDNPTSLLSKNIEYAGCFKPDELPYKLNGNYSLVWDGDSLKTCSGLIGNYLRYNNPHKISLSIISRLPVIIWEEAALADFVVNEKIGFTVKNLFELEEKISHITENQYAEFQKNLERLSSSLLRGLYLESALEKAEADINAGEK